MTAAQPHVSTAWINIASFDGPEEAETLMHVLRKDGMDARLQDERKLQKRWFLAKTSTAGVHIIVPEPSVASAQILLEKDREAERILQRAIHCPVCQSARVQFPQMTRKNVMPTLVAQFLVLIGLMDHEYYCESCHYTWRKEEMRCGPVPNDPPSQQTRKL